MNGNDRSTWFEQAASATPVLRAINLRKRYPGADREVVAGVSLDVGRGEWTAVMGRSGSGKSTLLHLLGGLDTPTGGTVEIAGTVISTLGESARARFRRRHVGYVFQDYNLVDDLTAVGNVELSLALSGVRHGRRRAAHALLQSLGLDGIADALPARLSGGERQRVALARALVTGGDLILADEPTGALDSASAELVVAQFRRARHEGRTIVMVTHDPSIAAAADRVVYMSDGVLDPAPQPGTIGDYTERVDHVVVGGAS